MRKIRRYGWRPDLPDRRDQMLRIPGVPFSALPASVDLRGPLMPPVYDQGQVGSCTGNSTAGAVQFERRRQQLNPDWVPSRLFIYYGAREIDGDLSYDGGAQIRDAIKSVVTWGAPPEEVWPYDVTKVLTTPTPDAYTAGQTDLAIQYQRIVASIYSLRVALAINNLPVVFGFTVYESFESDVVAQTGVVPMPGANEGVVGGHAVLMVGYDNDKEVFLVRNSWGEGWGMQGYFTLPYEFVPSGLAADFWQISKMS